MIQTRAQIILGLLYLPIRLLALAATIVWMIITMPLIFTSIVIVCPALILWIISPIVGLINPRVGNMLSSFMEPATDKMEAMMDAIWAPAGWLGEVALR